MIWFLIYYVIGVILSFKMLSEAGGLGAGDVLFCFTAGALVAPIAFILVLIRMTVFLLFFSFIRFLNSL
jgi:hypothetical protein